MNETAVKPAQPVVPAAPQNQLPQKQPDTIEQFLTTYKKKIQNALPRHISEKVFMRILFTEIARNPTLLKCTRHSLISCALQVAQIGLTPDSLIGNAYLIPYNNRKKGVYECSLQIGYKGLLDLAYRSGQIIKVDAHEVRENDTFEFEYGTNETLRFIPATGDRGVITHYCAIATLKNGSKQFTVCTMQDIEDHRRYSKTTNETYSPWHTAFTEMAKKTVIKKVLKYLPRSAENLNLPGNKPRRSRRDRHAGGSFATTTR
jgi:recombination protein RecT